MPDTDNTLPIPNILTLHSLLSSNPPLRPSLRKLTEPRDLEIQINESEYGDVEVRLGNTIVACKISAAITAPYEDRPFEGLFQINTEITPMCSPAFTTGNNNDFSTAAPSIIPSAAIPTASIDAANANNESETKTTANGNDTSVIMGGGAVMGLAADQSATEVLLGRLIEKAIRRSNALDLESLCIIAGSKCWSVRADIRFLNYDGNLIDAACLSVITALLHFRKQDIEVVGSGEGSDLIIYDENQREMVPLSVLHIPICITFQFFSTETVERNIKGEKFVKRAVKEDSEDEDENDNKMEIDDDEDEPSSVRPSNEIIIVDATAEEELLSQGSMTVTLNSNKELCQISKSGGLNIESSSVLECCQIASKIVDRWTKEIKKCLSDDAMKRRDLRAERELCVVNER